MWLLLQYAVDNASHERVLNPHSAGQLAKEQDLRMTKD